MTSITISAKRKIWLKESADEYKEIVFFEIITFKGVSQIFRISDLY